MDSTIRTVAIFNSPLSRYQVLPHFLHEIILSLKRLKIDCYTLNLHHDFFQVLKDLTDNPPDFTLAIHGLMPSSNGRFFSDSMRIPHLALLVDFPTQYLTLTESRYTIITCPDQDACAFLNDFKTFNRSFFLPHAVEKKIIHPPIRDKIYDIVFLGSYIDVEEILQVWKRNYPPHIIEFLISVAQETLSNPSSSFWRVFFKQANKLNLPQNLEVRELLYQAELYLRGLDRLQLLQAIQDIPIHIFGEGSWHQLAHQKNLVFHPEINFEQTLQVMRKAKIVLNSCPSFKYGGHERVFYGLAAGAAVLTNHHPFWQENFKDEESLLTYHYQAKEEINAKIHKALSQDTWRNELIQAGQKILLDKHTWDIRVQELIAGVKKFLV